MMIPDLLVHVQSIALLHRSREFLLQQKIVEFTETSKKKRDNFFDLDSVDESNEFPEKALSDITSVRYKPGKRSLLTKTNLLIRDHKSAPPQQLLYQHWNGRPRSVCSDQALWNNRRHRSSGMNLDVHKIAKWSQHTERGSGKNQLGYSTDERSFNTSLEVDEKSDSASDSLKYPRKQAEAKNSPEKVFHKSQLVDIDIGNKIKPSSQKTSDTDQTSHRNSGSPAYYSSYNRQHRGHNTFKYPEERKGSAKECSTNLASNHDGQELPEVPMLIEENTVDSDIKHLSRPSQRITEIAIDIENDVDVQLIFKTPADQDLLKESWSKTDYAPEDNEGVALP